MTRMNTMTRVETTTSEFKTSEVMVNKWLSRSGPVLGLFLVCLVFGFLVGPQFFRTGNLELIARQTAIVAVAALGMTVGISLAGDRLFGGFGAFVGRLCLSPL